MIATSTTKQPRKARFTTNYKTAEEDSFYINYKNCRGRLVLQLTTEQLRKACFTTNYRIAEAGLL